jgi:hypothetical protein
MGQSRSRKESLSLILILNLREDYPLPQLKPPSSYDECHQAFREIDDKVQDALSSPSRARYQVNHGVYGRLSHAGESPRDGSSAGSCRRNPNP